MMDIIYSIIIIFSIIGIILLLFGRGYREPDTQENKNVIPTKPGDPIDFDTYLGQDHVKRRIQLQLNAMSREDSLKMLFSAPAGIGKTALARVVAREMLSRNLIDNYYEIVAGKVKTKPQLDDFVSRIPANSLVFIDEIHGLRGIARDALLPTLQDNVYAYDYGSDTMQPLPEGISWLGATTDVGKVHAALQRRMTVVTLDPMSSRHRIMLAQAQPISVDTDAAEEMSRRCWTPWEIKDEIYAVSSHIAFEREKQHISKDEVIEAFTLLGIDKYGLRPIERNSLVRLRKNPRKIRNVERYGMSAGSLVAAVGMDKPTFYNKVEPKLLNLGFIMISPGIGRELTQLGVKVANELSNR